MQAQFERLTDGQWEITKLFLDWQRKGELDLRDVLDAILWLTRTGALERLDVDRECTPSLCIADSQSVKLAPMIFEHRGIDGNKKVMRGGPCRPKRQILVDTRGRIWKIRVHAANMHDSPAGVGLLDGLRPLLPRLGKIRADKSYRGTFCRAVEQEQLLSRCPTRSKAPRASLCSPRDGSWKERLHGSIFSE